MKRFTDGALKSLVSIIIMALPLGIFSRSFSMIGAILCLFAFMLVSSAFFYSFLGVRILVHIQHKKSG